MIFFYAFLHMLYAYIHHVQFVHVHAENFMNLSKYILHDEIFNYNFSISTAHYKISTAPGISFWINWLANKETGALVTVSHHSSGQSFPSWTDAWRGGSVEPNPSFTHTVLGLWLERDIAGRKREQTEKTKVGKEMRWQGFSLRGTSRAFVKAHVKGPPPSGTLLPPSSGCSALPLMPSIRVQGEE